jgi:hypothetical protein
MISRPAASFGNIAELYPVVGRQKLFGMFAPLPTDIGLQRTPPGRGNLDLKDGKLVYDPRIKDIIRLCRSSIRLRTIPKPRWPFVGIEIQ